MISNEMAWYMIIVSAILINNIVLIRFLGLCPFFGVSNRLETAVGMGMAVIFVMTIASSASWALWSYLLMPLKLEFLRTAAFILVIASLVQFLEMYIRKAMPALYQAMGLYLPLITTNCSVLGVAILIIDYNLSFINSLIYAISVAVGFTLALVLFAGIRERLSLAPIPEFLKGYPIIFITASLMSMAFLGFSHLFGL